ncbi:MAG: cytochrome C oxidase subunit IV family protein [Acidimicrobiia bacterium]|nr:cytochrome C oxidase subunit IV family protein [Acidimicrobiia bacterium]MYE67388.1 cytochrome C oxidase subunit IV family protein [Acidimicrobiia bacterium]
MSQTPPAPPAEEAAPTLEGPDGPLSAHAQDAVHEHPSDRQYVKIALILGVLTALEVFTYFESVHNLGDAALYVILIVLMVLKFVYVVAWFMHLKFDSVLFKRIFTAGVVLALGVYLVMLTAFRIWGV